MVALTGTKLLHLSRHACWLRPLITTKLYALRRWKNEARLGQCRRSTFPREKTQRLVALLDTRHSSIVFLCDHMFPQRVEIAFRLGVNMCDSLAQRGRVRVPIQTSTFIQIAICSRISPDRQTAQVRLLGYHEAIKKLIVQIYGSRCMNGVDHDTSTIPHAYTVTNM